MKRVGLKATLLFVYIAALPVFVVSVLLGLQIGGPLLTGALDGLGRSGSWASMLQVPLVLLSYLLGLLLVSSPVAAMSLVARWAEAHLKTLPPPRPRLALPPGHRTLALLRWLMPRATYERLVLDVAADFRKEVFDTRQARQHWRAKYLHLVYLLRLIIALALDPPMHKGAAILAALGAAAWACTRALF